MSKILILGAKGNLGGQLIKVLEPENEIIAWDREEIDITDKELITRKVIELKPDVIINVAAYNAVDNCEDNEEELAKAKVLNGDAVAYLADAAIETRSLLVHFTSDYVFSGDKEEGYREDDKTSSVSKYGETKLLGEKELISRSGKGLKWYLVRTSKLFGPKGESQGAKDSFFDLILKLSKDRKEFNMVHNEEISCFTYTLDLAKAVKNLIESDKGYGIYHIVNEGPASWYEGAKYLFELKGITDVELKPSRSADYPRPAKRPKYSVLLNTKLEPLRNWKEALREYLESGK
ncbi:MAG: dTDP-4-dehydrorhamnose reductase [Candidatus Gastranaerophilaceae bacterium]|jgi:dTDP-4-dehydrorhamnose reductase